MWSCVVQSEGYFYFGSLVERSSSLANVDDYNSLLTRTLKTTVPSLGVFSPWEDVELGKLLGIGTSLPTRTYKA